MDCIAELQALGPEQIFVQHFPMTPRYGRAAQKLRYILRASSVLGQRAVADPGIDAVEVAVWAPPPYGRGHGYYVCFRVFMEDGQPSAAVLFCFYDGTGKSPGFRSMSSAMAYAVAQGFQRADEQDS